MVVVSHSFFTVETARRTRRATSAIWRGEGAENAGLENRLESDELRQPQTSSTIDLSELSQIV